MTKYFFIGGINQGGSPRGGAEAKNQFLLKKLQEKYNEQLDYVDMTSSKNSFLKRYILLILGIIKSKYIIFSISNSALFKISFIDFLLQKKKKTIFLVGGVADQKLENLRFKKFIESAGIVYAETKALTKSIYQKSNRINVKHLPNFKQLIEFTPRNKSNKDSIIKFVFLSRVHRDKGVFRAINTVLHLNNKIKKQFVLDIYGPIDLSVEDKKVFDQQVENQYINYKGYLDLSTADAYTKLSEYHFFIFLTNHPSEGFPGVIIDALHSGSIIIASDWRFNKEIIPKTNLIVNLQNDYLADIQEYVIKISELSFDEYQKITQSQQIKAKKYDVDYANIEVSS